MTKFVILSIAILLAVTAYKNRHALLAQMRLNVGLFSIVVGLTALYGYCAFLSINTKWTAIALNSEPTYLQTFYNVLKLIAAVIPTDVALHYSLPTGVVFTLWYFTQSKIKDRQGRTTAKTENLVFGLAAIGVAIAATIIDYNICHDTGDVVGAAIYDTTAGEAEKYQTTAAATPLMQTPTIATATATTDPNLKKLAANGNTWASGKIAAAKNHFALQSAKMQMQVAKQAADANKAIALAAARQAEAVKATNAEISKREQKRIARAEALESKTQSKYTYRSIVSSVGSFLLLGLFGIIAFMLRVYESPNFMRVPISIFTIGHAAKTEDDTQQTTTVPIVPITTTPPPTVTPEPKAGATVGSIGIETSETSETSEKINSVRYYIEKYRPKSRDEITAANSAASKAQTNIKKEMERYAQTMHTNPKHKKQYAERRQNYENLAQARIEIAEYLNSPQCEL